MSLNHCLKKLSLDVSTKYYENGCELNSLTSILKELLPELEITGDFLDNLEQIGYKKFHINLKLGLPFKVKPVKDNKFPGHVMLFAGDEVQHEVVVDGYVNRLALHSWIEKKVMTVPYGLYNVNYVPQKYGDKCLLKFKFGNYIKELFIKPVIEFAYSDWILAEPTLPDIIYKTQPWYAVPQAVAPFDSRTFSVWVPHWENTVIQAGYNAKNVLDIMKTLCCVEMSELSEEIIRTVILNQSPLPLTINLGECLIMMWEKLCQYLKDSKMPKFLQPDVNMLSYMSESTYERCHLIASNILEMLHKFESDNEKEAEDELLEYIGICEA